MTRTVRPARPARRAAVLLGLLVALLLGGAGTASAHAALLSTDPSQGTVLAVAPGAVTLRFSESVTLEPDALRVFDPSGKRVDTGGATHAGSDSATARVRLGADAASAQGTYTVAWRVVSADTHPVAGAYTFSIGRTSAPATLTGVPGADGGSATGTTPTGFLYGAARAVQYGAFALLAGSVGAVLLCWPGGVRLRSVQRLMLAGWAGLLLATLAELALRGTYEAGTGLGRVFDLTLLRQVLGEKLGVLLALRVLLLAGAGVFLALLAGSSADESTALGMERRRRIWLGVTGAVLAIAIAVTWPLGDHASVGIQVPLAVSMDTLHVLAMSLWLGGLTTVLLGLRRDAAEGGIGVASVQRFSTLALCAITTLAASGTYQAWRGLGSWSALTSTTYGRLLLLKIGAVAVILAAAWISRRWLALLHAEAQPSPQAEANAGAGAGAGATASTDASTAAEPREAPADVAAGLGSPQPGSAEPREARAAGRADEPIHLAVAGIEVAPQTAAVASFTATPREAQAAEADAGREPQARLAVADVTADVSAQALDDTSSAAGPPAGPREAAAEGVSPEGSRQSGSAEARGARGARGAREAREAREVDPVRAAQLARQARVREQASARSARVAAPARGMLLRSVGLEAVFAVVVIVVTTILTNSAPGRAVAEQQAAAAAASRGPVDVTLPYDTGGRTPAAKGKVTIEIDPARTGQNSLHAYLYDATGKPVDVPEIDVALTLKAKNLGPLPVKLDHLDIGHYGAADLQLPLSGDWTLAVTVRSDDIDETTVTTPVAVG
ncbi:methionine-rich copper-binding protein CopC/putative copper export protein [Streptacidiphilus sp. MAP12-20]|uniref:copper resistance protein CopC n=1 Tax=Streptacidiphilus sp. MAP12-20 TaxID=3156299 RepID=UPI003516977D